MLLPNEISSNDKCKHDEKTFRCIQLIRVYDGDTIFVNINNVHSIIGNNVSIRLAGVDTPEMKTNDQCEKDLALIAKKFVEKELTKAKSITLTNVQKGKYFRLVSNVIYDGKNLRNNLIQNHLAYPYQGKTKEKRNWCSDLKRVPASMR